MRRLDRPCRARAGDDWTLLPRMVFALGFALVLVVAGAAQAGLERSPRPERRSAVPDICRVQPLRCRFPVAYVGGGFVESQVNGVAGDQVVKTTFRDLRFELEPLGSIPRVYRDSPQAKELRKYRLAGGSYTWDETDSGICVGHGHAAGAMGRVKDALVVSNLNPVRPFEAAPTPYGDFGNSGTGVQLPSMIFECKGWSGWGADGKPIPCPLGPGLPPVNGEYHDVGPAACGGQPQRRSLALVSSSGFMKLSSGYVFHDVWTFTPPHTRVHGVITLRPVF